MAEDAGKLVAIGAGKLADMGAGKLDANGACLISLMDGLGGGVLNTGLGGVDVWSEKGLAVSGAAAVVGLPVCFGEVF